MLRVKVVWRIGSIREEKSSTDTSTCQPCAKVVNQHRCTIPAELIVRIVPNGCWESLGDYRIGKRCQCRVVAGWALLFDNMVNAILDWRRVYTNKK